MAFTLDSANRIIMPAGDSGDLSLDLTDLPITFAAGDKLVFYIYQQGATEVSLSKIIDVPEGLASIRLASADTREMAPGSYKWNARVITDPETGTGGNLVANDATDNVITVFNTSPEFILLGVGLSV